MLPKGVQLTAKQRAFVAAYSGNAEEAAVSAGFSPASARTEGYRLMRKPHVVKAIRARETVELRPKVLSRVQLQEMWSKIAIDSNEHTKDRLKASELLAKSHAMFVERLDLTGGVEVKTQVDLSGLKPSELLDMVVSIYGAEKKDA